MAKSDTIQPSEVDWVNQRVAAATGVPLQSLYIGDGKEPNPRALRMDLDALTRLQRENDKPPVPLTHICGSCKQDVKREPYRQTYSISQKMAMSDAWSRELRRKIQESERKRETPQVRVDPMFEDWE